MPEETLTDWFPMATPPSRTGWYNVDGNNAAGRWPERMWYDAEHNRWRPTQFNVLVYHPAGDYFQGTCWQGRLG